MSKYKYRDKVSGQWFSEAVDEQRILEFVTRGTLTPYDFVLICENNEDDSKEKKMIRDEFPEAEDKWTLLRNIRLKLNKLWEAQLDEIMAIVSSGLLSKTKEKQRRCETSLKSFRKNFSSDQIKDEIKRLWNDEPSSSFIEDEIKHRMLKGNPKTFDLRPPSSGITEGLLSEEDFKEKFENLEQDLKKPLKKRGVYVFWAGEQVTYVGEATVGFKKRFNQHYNDQKGLTDKYPSDINPSDIYDKWFLHDATKLELYMLKNLGAQSISEFESLMIFHHGDPDNNYLPRDNKQSGSSTAPVEVALKIIDTEIRELKSTADGRS